MIGRLSHRAALSALITVASFATASVTAWADSVSEFYHGRTITILSGFGAGGMYGIYSHVIADHMPDHIPGHPKMIAQFMPGAGGVKAANYFMTAAPKDGTMIGLLSQSVALTQVLRGGANVRYDASKMHWIGSFDTVTNVLSLWNANTKARSVADMKTHEVIVGATGKGSIGYMNMVALKKLLGLKMRIIAGYSQLEDLDLALERGEVQGRAATFISISTRKMDWINDKKISNVVQFALRRDSGWRDVPLAQELTKDPEAQRMFRFLAAPSTIGRGLSLPPGTPPDRVAAMRKAFEDTVKDPKFLADAHGRKLPIDWASAKELTEAIDETVHAPKTLIDKVEKLFVD
jgi:tripartite-type tricarboxylate transporter receptor subunit TctC